jgi:MoaA/NifB/PqqE/SkfB family radical SAM enzyme
MDKYQIHKFSQKLLQKSVFPCLEKYLKGDFNDYNLAPISINLDLTTACNYQCPHCIDKDIINTGEMLDFKYVKELVKKWAENGLKSVILIGGGEPTIYPFFEEAVKFLKDLNLQVGIVTNGTQNKKIENICNLLNEKDWVRLSIDVADNETFQKFHCPRISTNLEDILTSAKKIHEKNSKLQIGYSFLIVGTDKHVGDVRLPNNIKQISQAAKLAKENGFTYFSAKPFIDPGGTRATEMIVKDLEEIKKEIKKSRELEDENFKVIESVNLLCFYDEELKKAMQNQPKVCHAQFFRLVVTPSGIFQCSLWRGFNNAKIIDTNKEVTDGYFQELYHNRIKMLGSFNAKEICKDVSCLYAPFNYWVEGLKAGELEAIDDFGDYFL